MKKKVLTGYLVICIGVIAYSQPKKPAAVNDYIFSDITIRKNLSYSANIPDGAKSKYYRYDLYEATRDSSENRPLIIWMHGGGFKFGSKIAKSIRIWSKNFAHKGYLCVAINYRLSKKNPLRDFKALVMGCYEAVEDIEQAIVFFKKNNVLYRIDTNCIILAGNSAGAMIALQSIYSSYVDLEILMNKTDSNSDAKAYNPHRVAAVINFWGAVFDTAWLKNANVPIVSVHGRKDRIVPYIHSETLYGGFAIHQKADSLNIPNRLKTYERYGHELQKHFIPILRSGATKRRWMEAGQFAADFLSEVLLEKSEFRTHNKQQKYY